MVPGKNYIWHDYEIKSNHGTLKEKSGQPKALIKYSRHPNTSNRDV